MRARRNLYTTCRVAIMAVVATTAGLMLPRVAMAAQVVNVAINVPAQVLANPCAPEAVAVSGVLHIVITYTADGSGGYSGTLSDNESFSGQGLVSGVAYQGSSTHESSYHATAPYPYTTHDIFDTEIISKGGSLPNYIVHMALGLTVTADGMPAVTADSVSMDCTG